MPTLEAKSSDACTFSLPIGTLQEAPGAFVFLRDEASLMVNVQGLRLMVNSLRPAD